MDNSAVSSKSTIGFTRTIKKASWGQRERGSTLTSRSLCRRRELPEICTRTASHNWLGRYIGTLATAHKTHTGIAIRADYADCADCGISKLLITGTRNGSTPSLATTFRKTYFGV